MFGDRSKATLFFNKSQEVDVKLRNPLKELVKQLFSYFSATMTHTCTCNSCLMVLQCMGYVPREGCMYFRGRSPRKYMQHVRAVLSHVP